MIELLEKFDIVTVPLPFRVTAPFTYRAVAPFPVPLSCRAPLLTIVPCRYALLPLGTWNVPLLVTPLSVGAPPPLLAAIVPVPLLVSVPPVMVTASFNCTVEPLSAWIVPPVLVNVPLPFSASVPPFVASSVPVLVNVLELVPTLMLSGFETFALMVAWLVRLLPVPVTLIAPAPWIVILLVSEAPLGW